MKTTNITGVGTTAPNTAIMAMETSIRPVLTAYDNVTFVERITVGTGKYRDIYAIDGINNLYFTIENNNTSNGYLDIRVFLRDNVQTNTYIATQTVNCVTATSTDLYLFDNWLYTFSKNNKLYAFMIAPKNALAPCYVAIDVSNGFIYHNETACVDDAVGNKYYINRYIPSVTYNENEKALFMQSIVTTNNTSSNTPYQAISNVVYKILNQQFNAMAFSLIQIGNKKYRQVYGYYLFIENGDDE